MVPYLVSRDEKYRWNSYIRRRYRR
jgi:hypothetical protein